MRQVGRPPPLPPTLLFSSSPLSPIARLFFHSFHTRWALPSGVPAASMLTQHPSPLVSARIDRGVHRRTVRGEPRGGAHKVRDDCPLPNPKKQRNALGGPSSISWGSEIWQKHLPRVLAFCSVYISSHLLRRVRHKAPHPMTVMQHTFLCVRKKISCTDAKGEGRRTGEEP